MQNGVNKVEKSVVALRDLGEKESSLPKKGSSVAMIQNSVLSSSDKEIKGVVRGGNILLL